MVFHQNLSSGKKKKGEGRKRGKGREKRKERGGHLINYVMLSDLNRCLICQNIPLEKRKEKKRGGGEKKNENKRIRKKKKKNHSRNNKTITAER